MSLRLFRFLCLMEREDMQQVTILSIVQENLKFYLHRQRRSSTLFTLLAASEKLIVVNVNTLLYQTSLVSYSYQ